MIKVVMLPHISHYHNDRSQSGIRRVVEAYFRYLVEFGVELVHPDSRDHDLIVVHAGTSAGPCDVAMTHGLYWTEDYPDSNNWQWKVNGRVIDSIRKAKEVTVPSPWVGESFARDMRFWPHVIPHGIEWDEWQHNEPNGGYVLWNKNRDQDVCDPAPITTLARRFPDGHFVSTFTERGKSKPRNLNVIGVVSHDAMKKIVQSALVYLSTAKETFGIGTLEAMASGVPVLGYAHGGNLDLVRHGVNGYLAEPHNFEDLAEGLSYCVKHRKELGANGREMAKTWTWRTACEKLAGVFEQAMVTEAPTVGVVIPIYNKPPDQIIRAVKSARAQDYGKIENIIVVDDGSVDGHSVQAAVEEATEGDRRVVFIRQQNGGVAVARNRGISELSTKYVVCLDADDWIEPRFVSRCVPQLEDDRSLGITYSGLRWHKPDNSTGISQWPGDFDFQNQLKRHNQVPTCCVFRRDVWERLGGYRQRYGPKGCGAEDAEFWLRIGAYGYGALKVTTAPLFNYSWLSGQTSEPDYTEVDWTAWHPWTADNRHPFASIAKPRLFSHPVRQYDEPVVSVIIPIGPGHETHVVNALDSLEAQGYRKWEAVLVWDQPSREGVERLKTVYPYARWVFIQTPPRGAGHARNRGVEAARADLILFLDADDWLYPQALKRMLDSWDEEEAITYTDYVGIAYVDDPKKLDPALQQRMYYYDEKRRHAVIGYRAADYDCERAQRQPEGQRPWIWCNVTALMPKLWHNEIGGFDEKMPSWEDYDYFCRLARASKCFQRIPEELLVYSFDRGNRREEGRQLYENLIQYLSEKYEKESEVMGCSGCGGRRRAAPRRSPQPTVQRKMGMGVIEAHLDDAEFVMIRYVHPNRGGHPVYGGAVFSQPIHGVKMVKFQGGWKINYGYRNGGGTKTFLVHKLDARLNPHFIEEVPTGPSVPKAQKEMPPPPTAMGEPARKLALDEAPPPHVIMDVEEAYRTAEVEESQEEFAFDPQMLPGVGAVLADKLRERGVDSLDKLIRLGLEGLTEIEGVAEVKAQRIMGAANAMTEKPA